MGLGIQHHNHTKPLNVSGPHTSEKAKRPEGSEDKLKPPAQDQTKPVSIILSSISKVLRANISNISHANQGLAHTIMKEPTVGTAASAAKASAVTLFTNLVNGVYTDSISNKAVQELKTEVTDTIKTLKSPITGTVTKFFLGLAKGMGVSLLKTETGRSFVKSIVTTSTRVTTEKILSKASSPEQKAEWEAALQKLDIYTKGKPDTMRVDQEGKNLDRIKGMKADTPSLKQLQSTLIKQYEVRIAVKQNLENLFKAGAKDSEAFNTVANAVLSHLGSPESLLKDVFNGLLDPSTGLKSSLDTLLTDTSTSAIIKAAMGEHGVKTLQLLTSEPGLKVIAPLIQHLSVDTALAFMENPVQALSTHGAELSKLSGEVFNQLVELLSDKASQETISQLSGGKVTQGDLQLASDVLPMMKEFASLAASGKPMPNNELGISLPSQIMVKVAGHLSTRLNELAPPDTQGPKLLETLVTDIRQSTETYLSSVSMLNKSDPEESVKKVEIQGPNISQIPDQSPVTVSNSTGGWFYSVFAAPLINTGVAVANAGIGLANVGIDLVSAGTELAINTGISVVTSGVELGKDTVLYTGSHAAGALISHQVSTELDIAEGIKSKPIKDTTLVLNQKKLENLALQTVSLMSQFIVENPTILDKTGSEVSTLFTSVAETLQNSNLTEMERSTALTDALSQTLSSMGTALQQEDSPLATEIGKTLDSVASVVNSDLVQLSLGRSAAFSTETLNRAGRIIDSKIAETTEKVIGENADKLGKESEVSEKKPITVQVSSSMAKAIQAGSYLAANEGGWGDSIIGSIFSSLSLGLVSSSVKFAGHLVEPPKT